MLDPHIVKDPARGQVRVYRAADVGRTMDVSTKTIVSWARDQERFQGWAPRTEANPDRGWMVDADAVDEHLEVSRRGAPSRFDLNAERERLDVEKAKLAEERQFIEVERSFYQQDKLADLTAENERLRAELAAANAELSRFREQAARLAEVVRDLSLEQPRNATDA